MARSFLTEAKLPKKFLFWAIRKANIGLNILPITQNEGSFDPAFMTTPHFELFGIKPDYRILFPFGCIGAFRWARDGNHNCTNFESQCMLGIDHGRSEYTNGMMFYNPVMDSFITSANYLINKNRHVGEVFPSLRHDGGLRMSKLSGKDDTPAKFNIGDCVFVQDNQTSDILEGMVTMSPTTQNKYFTITLVDDSFVQNVAPSNLYDKNDVSSAGKPSTLLGFFRLDWLKQGQKVTILHDDLYNQGF